MGSPAAPRALQPQSRLLLYHLMRVVGNYEKMGLPVLGVVGDARRAPVAFRSFDARSSLVGLARGESVTDKDGVWSLSRLFAQIRFLRDGGSKDPGAAEAMAAFGAAQRHLSVWHRRLGITGAGGALAQTAGLATALEVGMSTASGLTGKHEPPKGDAPRPDPADQRAGLAARMDELTNKAFRPPVGDGDPAGERARAEHLVETLFGKDGGLRHEPNEWLYDGFAKFDLAPVLESGKGMPFALAAVGTCLAGRVSVPAMPLSAPLVARCSPRALGCPDFASARAVLARGSLSAAPGPGSGADPHLARLQSRQGRYDASAADRWVLRVGEGQGSVFVDASRPGDGAVTPEAAAVALFGRVLAAELRDAHGSWDFVGALRVDGPALWAYLAGQVVQAYQRRGMSDHVASWIYARMALDPHAEEWTALMGDGGQGLEG